MATYNRTSLRAAEFRVQTGDCITDSTLIAREPNTPVFVGVTGLKFARCRFVRCGPPPDATCTKCTYDQRPMPVEPEAEEIVPVAVSELAAIAAAARDGKKADVADFCRKHGLTLPDKEKR